MFEIAFFVATLIVGVILARWSRGLGSRVAKSLVRFVAGVLILCSALMLLYVGALFHVSGYDPNFLTIDTCVDRGGAWDSAAKECRGARTD